MHTILLVSFMIMATANAAPVIDVYEQASSEITALLQQGSDDSACADLAKNLEDEVTSAVETANKQLDALADGSDCKNEGQEALAAAQSAVDNADKAAADAASAAQAATESEVDFGAYPLAMVKNKECGQFWENENFIAAMAAEGSAGEADVKAKAAAAAATEALQQATKSAADAKEACLCKVRDEYDAAWAAITESAKGHAEAYAKAKNMECVLAGTAAADCKVGDTPTTSPKTLSSDVPAESCIVPTPAPTPCPKICCKFSIYKNNNYNDFKGDYQQCSTSGESKYFDLNSEQRRIISSFKLSGDCVHVKVYDNDLELLQSEWPDVTPKAQDKFYTSSVNDLPNDLDNDIRAVKIWPTAAPGCKKD